MMSIQYKPDGIILACVISDTAPVCENQLVLQEYVDVTGKMLEIDPITGQPTGLLIDIPV